MTLPVALSPTPGGKPKMQEITRNISSENLKGVNGVKKGVSFQSGKVESSVY